MYQPTSAHLDTAIAALEKFQPGYSGKCFDKHGNPCPVEAINGSPGLFQRARSIDGPTFQEFFDWTWNRAGCPVPETVAERDARGVWASNDWNTTGFRWFQQTLHDSPAAIKAILMEERAILAAADFHAEIGEAAFQAA